MVEPLAQQPALPPLLGGGDPEAMAFAPEDEDLPPPAPPDLSTDPDAVNIDDPVNRVRINQERREALIRRTLDILRAYDAAMVDRRQRELEITRAYNQIPDPQHGGMQPGASRLVSEITRVHTGTASARISGSMQSIKPLLSCAVVASQIPKGEDTELYQKVASAIEHFMGPYFYDMGLDRLWAQDVRRSCRVGTSMKRILWEEKTRIRRYRDKDDQLQEIKNTIGGVKWRLVDNENCIVWPLHESDVQEMQVAGHRAWMVESAFVAWAKQIGADPYDIEKICAQSLAGGDPKPEEEAARLEDKDIKTAPSEDPLRGQIKVTELWVRLPIDDDDTSEDPRYRLVLHEGTQTLLALEHNPHWSGQHPYWDTGYVQEDGSFWSSGVGHEVLYEQAAGSALRNILIDNLKTIAHHVRIFKVHTQAMTHMGAVSPGYEFATEDPEKDFRVVKLGDDLELIYQALGDNDARASRNSGVTDILMGRGDPVMKTRASASGMNLLAAEGGKKFGEIDNGMRRGFSRMAMHVLHLLAQYGTPELFASILSEEEAAHMALIKDMPFVGLLDRVFRIEMKAPSAGANEETLKQNLFIVYNLAIQHIQVMLPLAQQVMGQFNPAGFLDLQKRLLECLGALFAKIVELHEAGVAAPEVEDPAPTDMVINQLFLALQELQAQLQSVMPQPSSPAGAAGPGAPGPSPGAPGQGQPMGPM